MAKSNGSTNSPVSKVTPHKGGPRQVPGPVQRGDNYKQAHKGAYGHHQHYTGPAPNAETAAGRHANAPASGDGRPGAPIFPVSTGLKNTEMSRTKPLSKPLAPLTVVSAEMRERTEAADLQDRIAALTQENADLKAAAFPSAQAEHAPLPPAPYLANVPDADAPWPVGKYRVMAKCYIPPAPDAECEIVMPGRVVVWDRMPAWFLEPLDEPARLAWEDPRFPEIRKVHFDPIEQLPLTIGD